MRIKIDRYLNYKNELHVDLHAHGPDYPSCYTLTEAEATMLRDDLDAALAGPCIDCASETHMTGSNHCPVASFDVDD